jgi:hypothetical protein
LGKTPTLVDVHIFCFGDSSESIAFNNAQSGRLGDGSSGPGVGALLLGPNSSNYYALNVSKDATNITITAFQTGGTPGTLSIAIAVRAVAF